MRALPLAVQKIGINLDRLDPTKKYLQVKTAETNTYEGFICVVLIANGERYK